MTESDVPPLGLLFPSGGRVSPEQMIGREGDVADLIERLAECVHIVLSGPRRAGKTSVCGAVCAELRDSHGFLVLEVEVPEQSSAAGVCQLIIDRSARLDLERMARSVLKTAVPTIQKLLESQGVPLDLSQFGADVPPSTRRAALALPLAIARQQKRRVVLFLDELQRAVDYVDGLNLVHDLVDIYAGNPDVVILVDGSEERTVEQLMGKPYDLARLCQRRDLAPTIPIDQWRRPILERFERATLPITTERLDGILSFGGGRPYDTMTACLYTAMNARRVQADEIDGFVLEKGLEEARARLDDDQ
jgi:AAA ATPase domain